MQSATRKLSDYTKMITTNNEAIAKLVKQCDADSIKEIKTIMDENNLPNI